MPQFSSLLKCVCMHIKQEGEKRLLKYELALDIPSVKNLCFSSLDYKHILQVNFGATCFERSLSGKRPGIFRVMTIVFFHS